MCIRQTGTATSAAAGSMCGSNVPPETSLIISAPAPTAARAHAAWRVSMEIGTSETRRSASMRGTVRCISSSGCTSLAPGRVLSPPMSMMSAPSSAIRTAEATATSISRSRPRPPSEKLSGVAFRIPMTTLRSIRSTRSRGSGTTTAPLSLSGRAARISCSVRPPVRKPPPSRSDRGASTNSLPRKRGCGTSRSTPSPISPRSTVQSICGSSPYNTMSISTVLGPFRTYPEDPGAGRPNAPSTLLHARSSSAGESSVAAKTAPFR
mmetsp:Transcript_17767/g.35480  ORF Transcript_17767/g.35480 Transcript_17767/m.35480 type:complete len:265 (-) Transcript_17767:287-1081(-)